MNGFILEQEILKRDSLLRLPTCDLREKFYLSEIHKSTDFITWRENFYDNLGTDREKKVGMFVPNTYFIIVLSYILSSQNNFKKFTIMLLTLKTLHCFLMELSETMTNYFRVQNLHSTKFEGKNLCKISWDFFFNPEKMISMWKFTTLIYAPWDNK